VQILHLKLVITFCDILLGLVTICDNLLMIFLLYILFAIFLLFFVNPM